jgi:hypothetical protein
MNISRMAAAVLFAALNLFSLDSMAEMKMTTEIPDGISTPNNLETSIGTLKSVDGVPDAKTRQLVYDNLDLQRATQAFLSTIQISSLEAFRLGLLKFGPPNQTVLVFEDLMDSKALWLTPNTVSIYMVIWIELGDEPMVIETPPNVLGLVDDAWFRYVGDFGNAGPDRGEGGKFLLVPETYNGKIPDGYHVMRTPTKGNWTPWRGFQVDGSTELAVKQSKELFKVYPLSQKDDPPAMNFINASGVPHSTIHRMDYGYWEELHSAIERENLEGLEPEIRGLLASIGIAKGKPFSPDARMKKILTDAAQIGSVTARALASYPRDENFFVYPDRRWTNPFLESRYDFLKDGASLLDSRIYMHYYATGITPAMAMKMVGKGSQYLISYTDQDDKPLDGRNTYKVRLPANVPAQDFWSFTLYDNQTRSMLQTDQRFPGLDSNGEGLRENSDGSYDIYVGPKAPQGWENNWIQADPSKGWNVIFRLYGPLEPWFDQSWKPGDFEQVSILTH